MTHALALYRRPSAVVFLDDDPDYLDMLALILPSEWKVDLFLRTRACLNHVQTEPASWEADAWAQQQIVDNWRAGRPLIPQILRYWAAGQDRYGLTRLCVFDYGMPGMNGLQALSELSDWPGARILLTGQADERIAVDAFNRGLIQRFIPKQVPNASRLLIEAIRQLLDTPDARHAQTWRATLNAEQYALLRDTAHGGELMEQVHGLFTEHIVIGEPFGVIGLDTQGRAGWLQLESAGSLPELADLAADQGVPAQAVADIRSGRQLIDIELQQNLGSTKPPRLAPATALGQGSLFCAYFPIDPDLPGGACAGHAEWLARQGERVVQD